MSNKFVLRRFSVGLVMMIGWSLSAHAVPCYLTLVKDSCWKMYDVTVDIHDAQTDKKLGSIIVPLGTAWGRQAFECTAGQTLALFAQFSPPFWSTDENKVFPGQRYWKLPDELKSSDVAWNVTVCFPKYFANVPMPPDATSHCACEVDKIPKVSP